MTEAELDRLNREQSLLYLARFLVVVAAVVLLVPIAVGAFQLQLLMVFSVVLLDGLRIPLGLAFALAAMGSLVWGVRSAMRKAWKRCVMTAILPVVLIVALVNPVGFFYSLHNVGELARFIALKSSYDRIVAALPANQRPGLVTFVWDGFLGASNGVVYDATDQVMLPRGRQSHDWLVRANRTELQGATGESAPCGYSVRPLWDHYYFAGFWC